MKCVLHVPQRVAKSLDLTQWGICKNQVSILAKGPVSLNAYWSAWGGVVENAKTVVNGKEYSLFCGEDMTVLIVDDDFHPELRAF